MKTLNVAGIDVGTKRATMGETETDIETAREGGTNSNSDVGARIDLLAGWSTNCAHWPLTRAWPKAKVWQISGCFTTDFGP